VANAQLGFESVLLHQLTKQVDNYLVQVYWFYCMLICTLDILGFRLSDWSYHAWSCLPTGSAKSNINDFVGLEVSRKLGMIVFEDRFCWGSGPKKNKKLNLTQNNHQEIHSEWLSRRSWGTSRSPRYVRSEHSQQTWAILWWTGSDRRKSQARDPVRGLSKQPPLHSSQWIVYEKTAARLYSI